MAPGRRAATILVVGGVPAIIIFIFRLLQAIKTSRKRKELEDRADKRRSKATQQIDEVVAQAQDGSDGESSGGFTCIPYKELKLQIEKGKLGVYDVVCAYRRKAATLHKELNCLTGFIDEALEHAKVSSLLRCGQNLMFWTEFRLSERIGTTERCSTWYSCQCKGNHSHTSRKQLISLAVLYVDDDGGQGYDSTAGIAKRCGVLSDEDSVAIAAIKEAGGIPFCRTNIPQTNLSYGSIFRVMYQILELPRKVYSALDYRRISRRGSFSVLPGQTGVAASFGPMAKEVDTVAAAMSALVTHTSKYDSFVVSNLLKSREVLYIHTYQGTDSMELGHIQLKFKTQNRVTACARAVREACEAMRARGHHIVPFAAPHAIKVLLFGLQTHCPEHMSQCLLLFIKLLTADGGESVFELLQDEKVDGSLRAFVEGVRVSGSFWAGKLLPKALRRQGKKRVADLLESQGICSTAELWKAQSERLRLQLIWERAFKEAGKLFQATIIGV
eukprot:754827-Hanusia_phi.AAC.1